MEAAAREITETAMIGHGPLVARFEDEFARLHGSSGAVAVNSGTSALHLGLLGLGVGSGDEVIIPGYVCSAVLNAIRYVGAEAVLTDSDPGSFNMDIQHAVRSITARTRAIIVPHMFGSPADIRPLLQTGVPVLEDCAQSIGARFPSGEPVGSLGALGIFSFHATKMMTTGAGGMIVANSAQLVDRMVDLRDYDERDEYIPRYNYQLSDLAAAIGLRQLKRLPAFVARRREIASTYSRSIASKEVTLPCQPAGGVYYRYVVRTPRIESLVSSLAECGISARRPVYRPLHHYVGGDLPGCDEIHRTGLSIPLYPALTDTDVDAIISARAWRP